MRFVIKNTASKAEKEGDVVIRHSGIAEPFIHVSLRTGTKIGVDGKGEPIVSFETGLDESKVKFFKWYNDEEKKSVVKQIKEMRKEITDFYGGEEVLDHTNKYFWKDTREINRVQLTNNDTLFYDTKNPAHALLYLSIISGAFHELVAPTRDWAERHQIMHYLALESEDVFDDEDVFKRSDAHSLLSELRKDASGDALFILAWCLQYDTVAYGAYLKSTPLRDLVNYHIMYIDGKLVSKRKRDMPGTFIEYAEKWKGQQTRPALFVEAYVKAGEYYNFINQREKKYVMTDGTVLGNTISDAVSNLMKPKFTQDLEKLRKQVEDKWKE